MGREESRIIAVEETEGGKGKENEIEGDRPRGSGFEIENQREKKRTLVRNKRKKQQDRREETTTKWKKESEKFKW